MLKRCIKKKPPGREMFKELRNLATWKSGYLSFGGYVAPVKAMIMDLPPFTMPSLSCQLR